MPHLPPLGQSGGSNQRDCWGGGGGGDRLTLPQDGGICRAVMFVYTRYLNFEQILYNMEEPGGLEVDQSTLLQSGGTCRAVMFVCT